jgi:hypothetical protein
MELEINNMLESILKEEDTECSTLSFSSDFDESSISSKNSFSRSSIMEAEEVLEKIKTKSKISQHNFDKMSGNFLSVVKSQSGSRILQSCLAYTQPEIIKCLFYELKFKLVELIVDPYANYFCPKLFNVLKTDEKIEFLLEIQNNVLEIGINKIGTYPLQVIIGNLTTPIELSIMVNACSNFCLQLCQDPQGVHVIEKFITTYKDEAVSQIYAIIIQNLSFLSMNVNGLCATKKIVTESRNIMIKQIIRDAIKQDAVNLIQHVYGNYVIQTALEKWDIHLLLPITQQFYGNFQFLSIQKYSSNVLEKCFEKLKELIILPFIEETSLNMKVVDLMRHSYGNYVIQKAIKLSTGISKRNYISLIMKNINRLQDKKLIIKWVSIIESANLNNDNETVKQSIKITPVLSSSARRRVKVIGKCQ